MQVFIIMWHKFPLCRRNRTWHSNLQNMGLLTCCASLWRILDYKMVIMEPIETFLRNLVRSLNFVIFLMINQLGSLLSFLFFFTPKMMVEWIFELYWNLYSLRKCENVSEFWPRLVPYFWNLRSWKFFCSFFEGLEEFKK